MDDASYYACHMPIVIVASTNPVKINATKLAFDQMLPGSMLVVEGLNVPSGVPDQPMGTEETILGARNRVQRIRELRAEADFWVGIEGGLVTDELGQLVAIAWIVIINKDGHESKASAGTFVIPTSMANDIKAGMEMGQAADKLHGSTNVKQNLGTVGILTNGAIDRTEYYKHAAILALIPYQNPHLY